MFFDGSTVGVSHVIFMNAGAADAPFALLAVAAFHRAHVPTCSA
jgi:hypothetical protein